MTKARVKVCGLTRLVDAELAVALGASAIGFNFWPNSPRAIDVGAARAIARQLPPFVTRVGVFVNASPDDVARTVRDAGLDVAQLHGDEAVALYEALGFRLVKTVTVADDDSVAAAQTLPAAVTPLVDAVDLARRGGTGHRADWTRAAALARRRRVILAGGLTAENVARAIQDVQPWAVDVASGVEEAPGIKSAARLRAFFSAVAATALEVV